MSDDDSELMPQVFVVEGDEDEFNLDIPPTSGMEFLKRVQQEAREQPCVIVADIDRNKFKKNQTVGVRVSDYQSALAAPAGYGPSEEWQRKQAADFFETRQKMTRYKARMKKGEVKCDSSVPLPRGDNVNLWCNLCFGKLLKKVEDPETPPAEPVTHVYQYPETGLPPTLGIIARLEQPTVIQLLGYHVNWMEATGFTHKQGQWFYSLLCVLEKPVDPEACAVIRNLARLCSNLRASLESPEDDRLNALNLLICIVGRYFDQKDLSDCTGSS